MNNKNSGSAYLGIVLLAAIMVLAVFTGFATAFGAASSTVTSEVVVGHATPTVSAVSLNHGTTPLVLTPNATTSFDINYTVTDNNGCSNINTNNMTSTAFRNGVNSTCAVPSPTTSNQNCYLFVASTRSTSTCQSLVTINVTDTVQIWYFADSTNGTSSTFPNDNWEAYATAGDTTNATGSATSTGVEVNVLTAVNVATSSINYGTIAANANTGSTNQTATTTNAGNSSTTLQLYALSTLTSGANSLATSSQHYATSTFTFGGAEQSLTDTAATVSGFLLTNPTSTSFVQSPTFWGITIAAGKPTGTYTGTNVFSPLFQP